MLRKNQITLLVFFFMCTTLLFLDFSIHAWFIWMIKVQFLPVLLALNLGVVIVLVALTFCFGRIYCSVGIMQDVFAWLGRRGK